MAKALFTGVCTALVTPFLELEVNYPLLQQLIKRQIASGIEAIVLCGTTGAFILNLGLESLHVRMPRHVENGLAVAQFLEQQPQVAYVNYPGLPSNKYYETAKKYMPNGGCGVVSFELKGGRAAAEAFMKELKLAAIETHVADARTCCLNPATSTHRQMTDEQLIEAGVPAGLVRISCGLEDKNDLIADLSQALQAIQ